MNMRQHWVAVTTSAVMLVLVGVLALGRTGTAPSIAYAQTGAEVPRTITVVGQGTVRIKPDIARANIGVEVMEPTVQEASSAATAAMESVLTALEQQGIDEKDIQTSGFSIWVDRPYGPEGMPSDNPVYRVNNTVSATIRDLDNIGAVLDGAIEAGANGLMVNYLAVGFPVLRALAEDPDINVPILGHMDVAGVYYASPDHGISAPLIMGKLARLAGADMVVNPYHSGKVAITRDQCVHIGRNLTFPFYDIKRAWPMPSGGIYPFLVPQVVEDFGLDVMIGAGGGVHAHPMGATAGGRAFRQAVEAVTEGRPVEEAASEYEELQVALETWRDPYKDIAYASKEKC